MLFDRLHLVFFIALGISLFAPAMAPAASNCYTCHDRRGFSRRVVHQPVAAGQCTACHNPHVARFAGLLAKPLAELCFSCHEEKASTFAGRVVHQPVLAGNCLACHDPHSADGKGLVKGDLSGLCFGCHTDLKKQYKRTHSPYAKGQCTSCHQPHSSESPLLLRTEDADNMCYTCHKRDAVRQGHRNSPVPVRGCLSCHNPHGSDRQGLVRNVLHSPYRQGCASCHQGKSPPGAAVCLGCHKDVMQGVLRTHSHLAMGRGNSCIKCHTPHAGDTRELLKGHMVSVCRSCHEDTFRRQAKRLFVHSETINDCGKCHAVHGSNRLAMLKDDGNAICVGCHKSQGVFSHPVGKGVLDQRTGAVMTCVTCHNPHGTDYKNQLRLSGAKALCVQCHQFGEGR